jgi:hypothetical protein
MKKICITVLGVFALGFMSCMVVVDEDDRCHDCPADEADTVTVIFSQAPNGIAASSQINR